MLLTSDKYGGFRDALLASYALNSSREAALKSIITREYVGRHFIKVEIYYKYMTTLDIEEKEAYSLAEFGSEIGELLLLEFSPFNFNNCLLLILVTCKDLLINLFIWLTAIKAL